MRIHVRRRRSRYVGEKVCILRSVPATSSVTVFTEAVGDALMKNLIIPDDTHAENGALEAIAHGAGAAPAVAALTTVLSHAWRFLGMARFALRSLVPE